MKTIVMLLLISALNFTYSQVAIGKSPDSPSAILDFKTNTHSGLLLPEVIDISSINTPGTLYYDVNLKRVYLTTNKEVFDLSGADNLVTSFPNVFSAGDPSVIIGDKNTTAKGALILESNNKALQLPVVSSVLSISSPAVGTIVYDPDIKMIAIFNGTVWSFWNNR